MVFICPPIWCCYCFPMVFVWFSCVSPYGSPMVFLGFSYDPFMVFLWFPYGFLIVFPWFSDAPLLFPYGFPMVFLWFSLWFSYVPNHSPTKQVKGTTPPSEGSCPQTTHPPNQLREPHPLRDISVASEGKWFPNHHPPLNQLRGPHPLRDISVAPDGLVMVWGWVGWFG